MYISKIELRNFRNFKGSTIHFNDGINVLIGHNNAGKTNVLKALSLIFEGKGRKSLSVDDFSKNTTFDEIKVKPPKIRISVTIKRGEWETPDDLVVLGDWLTKLQSDYEALLTYEFYLPESDLGLYKTEIEKIDKEKNQLNMAWAIIEKDFIKRYKHKVWGGDLINQNQADSEYLNRFDFQFLDAIRDVERDMLTGKNTLLRDVLDFFIDYDIKSLHESEKSLPEKEKEIRDREGKFSVNADKLLKELQSRMAKGQEQILSYAKETGVSSFNNAEPSFEGSITETELFSALRLIVKYSTGIDIPATHNGLGYNNLIFMSLLLAKMQVDADGEYMGGNAMVFPMLAIEEPEAHLHPSMQHKFLKFLKKNRKQKKVRQVFVTTHSTHITSAVTLDEIVCLQSFEGKTVIGYPGKVFNTNGGSKNYVQRFLDATKSDMLFANKVILVEGIAEQLLIPVLANYLGKNLEDHHISVINVGGRYFDHFLKLFDQESDFAIPKKIACISDRDPVKKKKNGNRYKSCFPFEWGIDTKTIDYSTNSNELIERNEEGSSIQYFTPIDIFSKTLEYDLILENSSTQLLLTESIQNHDELTELMRLNSEGKSSNELIEKMREGKLKKKIVSTLAKRDEFEESDKREAIIAARYLSSIGKGENALELSSNLKQNLSKKEAEDFVEVKIPNYIKDAIDWICK